MYFQNNRSGTGAIDSDIDFGDATFPAGTSVAADSQARIAQLSYEYAFLRRQQYELSGGLGLHYVDMDLSLAGESGVLFRDEEASTQAPLPVLGLRGVWRLSQSLYATGQVQYFYLDFDPYSRDECSR